MPLNYGVFEILLKEENKPVNYFLFVVSVFIGVLVSYWSNCFIESRLYSNKVETGTKRILQSELYNSHTVFKHKFLKLKIEQNEKRFFEVKVVDISGASISLFKFANSNPAKDKVFCLNKNEFKGWIKDH